MIHELTLMGRVIDLKTPEENELEAYLVTINADGEYITLISNKENFESINYETFVGVKARLEYGIEDIYYQLHLTKILYVE